MTRPISESGPTTPGSRLPRALQGVTLAFGALGLCMGILTLARDIPDAYTEGRLSRDHLAHLADGPASVAIAAGQSASPVKVEAEALPPEDLRH